MSDDEPDQEILALLREQLGIGKKPVQQGVSSDTGVLRDAEFISYNSIDVFIDMLGTQSAALKLYKTMRERNYSTEAWSAHPLHPKLGQDVDDVGLVNFVFTMDLLNFSFWSELDAEARFQVHYRGKRWTGYNSLVACLGRALDDGIAVTTPRFWRTDVDFDETMRRVFRSATDEEVPLLDKRITILREAGRVLHEDFDDDDDDDENLRVDEDVDDDMDEHVNVGETPVANNSLEANPRDQSLGDGTDKGISGLVDGKLDTSSGNSSHEADTTPSDAMDFDASGDSQEQVEKNGTDVNSDLVGAAQPARSPTPIRAPPPSRPDMTVINLIEEADHSAGKLVNLLAKHFPCFRDEGRFDGRKVRFLKRAQIFVADLWAAFNGKGYGHFHDMSHLTMFADYRVPQMLYNLGVLSYSPPLESRIRRQVDLESGHSWEQQLRGSSIWAVELIRRQIVRDQPEAAAEVNSVLLDFLLYDLAKEAENVSSGKLSKKRFFFV